MSTYQAVSGAGSPGIDEILAQTKAAHKCEDYHNCRHLKVNHFSHQILFNVIPHIDTFMENDYTKEEMKVTHETQKIFHDRDLKISVTAVRVPVLRAHSEAITIELENDATPEAIRALLSRSEGIEVVDDIQNHKYPMPLLAINQYDTYVGRIRKDLAFDKGISLWVVADQVLKGAALNAVQIAEWVVKMR